MSSIRVYESEGDSAGLARLFREELAPVGRPVVLRGLDLGECTERWVDQEHLKRLAEREERPVKVHVAEQPHLDFRSKNFEYKMMSLGELVSRASAGDDQHFYYLRAVGEDPRGRLPANVDRDFPHLSSEFKLPDQLFETDRAFSSVLRVSSPMVRLWTHYDVMDNVYAQVVGHKTASLWPPNQALKLYLDGDKSKVSDPDSPDLDRFPLFATAERMDVELEPGDVLYIPSMWFHNTKAKSFGIGINVFWKNLEESVYDTKDPYANRDLLPAAKAMRMLDNVCRQLQDLPEDIQDFYGRMLISKIEKKCLNRAIQD